jgi:tetratricopeptide (TPR) repeat protein
MDEVVVLKRKELEDLLEINDLLLERCGELLQEVRDSKQLLREIRKTYFEILELEAKRDLGVALTVVSPRGGDRQGTLRLIQSPALKHRTNTDREETVRLYRQSLKIKERLGDWLGIGATLYKLATMEQQRGNYDTAEKLYKQSLELDRELRNQKRMKTTLQRVATIQQERRKHGEVEEPYNRSQEITQRQPDQRKRFSMLRDILIQARTR